MSGIKLFIRKAVSGAEGDGAEVSRLFPVRGFMNYDPFVLWDDFTISPSAGFPDHPHRGFEGITYVLQGSINHSDNLGNNSTVHSGGLQRFTAGKGIIHSEMPSPDQVTKGIQMWVNLPPELKKTAPGYQQVMAEEVQVITIPGGQIRVLSDEQAQLSLHTKVIYQDVKLEGNQQYSLDLDEEMRGFVYVLAGEITVSGEAVKRAEACFIEKSPVIDISARQDSRFLLCFGLPHHQPIIQHGSFVD